MTERVVVDASVVIAVLRQEPGGAAAAGRIQGALLSAVNLSEVLAKIAGYGTSMMAVMAYLESVKRVEIVPVDAELARVAAELLPFTKASGLSLGDRICLATALRERATVLTMDSAWDGLRLGIRIELVRPRKR